MKTDPNPDCTGHYWDGCRCTDCRTWNTTRARDRRERRRTDSNDPTQWIPAEPARDAVHQMRAAGLTWDQISLITATERTTAQRLHYRKGKWVTRGLAERILTAAAVVAAHPDPTTIEATMTDAAFTRWMVAALMANGWTSTWIGQQLGWGNTRCTPRDVAYKRVHLEFEARVRVIFDGYAHQHGPSRQTAMIVLRKGWFPAACYDWEDRDFRPIPGSLHPDLVTFAATTRNNERRKTILRDLAGWGQWPTERCARTSMHLWAEATGRTFDTDYSDIYIHPGRTVWCRNPRHDHTPPSIWTTESHNPAIAG